MFENLIPDDGTIIYHSPKNSFIGIVSIPHSGEIIPDEMRPFLVSDKLLLQKDVDTKVDQLIDIKKLTDNGIAIVISQLHRTAIDINRSREKTLLCWKNNTQGEKLVIKEPDSTIKEELLKKYYDPYYKMITDLVNELSTTISPAPFIDLHSMPSIPTEHHLKQNPNQNPKRASFCLSDLLGKSCPKDFIDSISKKLTTSNYNVFINDPYFGGFVTQYINKLDSANIQIEINRAIYMDESTREIIEDKVIPLKKVLTESILATFKEYNV